MGRRPGGGREYYQWHAGGKRQHLLQERQRVSGQCVDRVPPGHASVWPVHQNCLGSVKIQIPVPHSDLLTIREKTRNLHFNKIPS